jgi:ribosomal protein S12 methylthiotransferase accessory factor
VERLTLASVEKTPNEVSLRALRSLVSPLTGIVPFTTEFLYTTDDAPVFHWASVATNSEGLIGVSSSRYNGGMNFTSDAAFAAAVGEAAERYAGAFVPNERIRLATAAELDGDVAPPESFALFDATQYARAGFPFVRFTRETRLGWTRGHRLPDGDPVWLPAQLVYLNSHGREEALIGYGTSSGMACAVTREEAILSGLLELVERDAFQLAWYGRISAPLVDWSGDAQLLEDESRFFANPRLEYRAIDVSRFLGVPTALGTVRSAVGNVALAVGAASAPTMREAVRKAVREAFQTRVFARQLVLNMRDWRVNADFSSVRSFEDHVMYHALRENEAAARFLDASSERVSLEAIENVTGDTITSQLRDILSRLARAGVDTYVVDLTTSDIAAAGLHVVCVVCPQLCRLDVAHEFRYLGGRRITHAAYEAGFVPRPLRLEDLNPHPHPFP